MNLSKLLSAFCITATLPFVAADVGAQIPPTASLLDDCEGGTDENRFGERWYFFDDSPYGGNSSIHGSTPGPTGLLGCGPVLAGGNNGTAGYLLSYTMGTKKCPIPGAASGYNFVGIGTRLAPEGSVCDLTGASKITFWAKATPAVTISVEVAISDIKDSNYHRVLIDVNSSWTEYAFLLVEGTNPPIPKVPFNHAHVEKIQWLVHSDQVPPPKGDLNIDDIVIHDFKFVHPELCPGCLYMAMPANNALLSDLDAVPVNGNNAGGWWYCYNDAAYKLLHDESEIYDGVFPPDPSLPHGTPPDIKIDGHGKTGNGAYIGFQLGPSFMGMNVEKIKPFVGIETFLSDKLASVFYNALADGHTGVAFDYKLTGARYVRFEVVSENDNSDRGILWGRLFPESDTWRTAVVPFDSLVLRKNKYINPSDPALALKKDRLKKLRWTVQDDPETIGALSIDNVYFFGGTNITPFTTGTEVVSSGRRATVTRIASVALTNRNLFIRLPPLPESSSGTISLVSIRGMTVATISLRGAAGDGSVALDVSNVANGMYLCVVKAAGGIGERAFTKIMPVALFGR